MKPIRWTAHAIEQCVERGAKETEVREAIKRGVREPAKLGSKWCQEPFYFVGESL